MPRLLAPHKSGLHRQACLSLYRSLLRTATRIGTTTSNPSIAETLRALIRYRFQQDRSLLSQSQVSNGLIAGHDFLALLGQCAAKSAAALDRLGNILGQVNREAEVMAKYRAEMASRWKPPKPSRYAHLQNLRRVADKANHTSVTASSRSSEETTQPPQRIFQHPRPISEVKTGVRKVPNLILAQGIPLLKYPGPTPVIVNRVLKEKILWGIRKWEQHKDVLSRIQIAEWEDAWDMTLAEEQMLINEDEAFLRDADAEEDGDSSTHVSKPRIAFTDHKTHVNGKRSASASGRRKGVHHNITPRLSWTMNLREVDRSLEAAVLDRGREYALLGDRYFHDVIVKERELKERERKEKKHARRMASKEAVVSKEAAVIFGKGEEFQAADEQPSSLASGFL